MKNGSRIKQHKRIGLVISVLLILLLILVSTISNIISTCNVVVTTNDIGNAVSDAQFYLYLKIIVIVYCSYLIGLDLYQDFKNINTIPFNFNLPLSKLTDRDISINYTDEIIYRYMKLPRTDRPLSIQEAVVEVKQHRLENTKLSLLGLKLMTLGY